MRNKRDTEANWEKKNPLILDGEIIVVTTASGETRVKIGDGVKLSLIHISEPTRH